MRVACAPTLLKYEADFAVMAFGGRKGWYHFGRRVSAPSMRSRSSGNGFSRLCASADQRKWGGSAGAGPQAARSNERRQQQRRSVTGAMVQDVGRQLNGPAPDETRGTR